MDPVTLILNALVAGAATVAGEAVSDIYKGLKSLIQNQAHPDSLIKKLTMTTRKQSRSPAIYQLKIKLKDI